MSGLALLAARAGASVTASDKADSVYLQKLAEKGITTWTGSHPEKIPDGASVFYSTAIKAEDRERAYAEAQGWPCNSRHSLLKEITAQYFTIAIAGCHGKTTTSAWIADLLVRAGADPTALIGGTVPQWNSNYRQGQGQRNGKPLLVVEADESDKSFLSIVSAVSLVTNVDLDHTDVHESLASLEADFVQFASRASAATFLSAECRGVLDKYASPERLPIGISVSEHCLTYQSKKFSVGLAGEHNLKNATLVMQFGFWWGLPEEVISASLREFSGVNRRMQRLAELKDLTVIDDYAHHPQEIAATLATLEKQFERLIIFWEPHRLSRFVFFANEFEAVLNKYGNLHEIFVLPIFASGDRPEDYPEVQTALARFTQSPFRYLSSIQEFSAPQTRGFKTAAVFMGAGLSSDYAHAYVRFIDSSLDLLQ